MGLAKEFLKSYENGLVVQYGVIAIPPRPNILKPPKQPRTKHASAFEYESIGEVLGDLEKTFGDITKKKFRPEDRHLIKKIGLFIFSKKSDTRVDEFNAGALPYGLPAILPLAFNSKSDDGQHWGTTVVIFKKMKNHHTLEPAKKGAAIYEVCYLYSSKREGGVNKKSCETNFFCEISTDGAIRQLRHLNTDVVHIRLKRGGYAEVPKREWAYQPVWDVDHQGWRNNKEAGRREAAIFFNVAMARETNVNIVVTDKQGFKVVFLVPTHRWKYFFKDRIDVMVGGKKTKIFHWVCGHKRRYGDKTSYIKPHTRGSREFQWGEYSVRIILPGKHGLALSDFNVSPERVDDDHGMPEGYVDEARMYSAVSGAMGH